MLYEVITIPIFDRTCYILGRPDIKMKVNALIFATKLIDRFWQESHRKTFGTSNNDMPSVQPFQCLNFTNDAISFKAEFTRMSHE